MIHELSVYKLGEALSKINKQYPLGLTIKRDLSGGWMTLNGEAKIEIVPTLGGGCNGKNINILEIRFLTDNSEGALIKITGGKNKNFLVDVSSGKYKEISLNGLTLNKVKENKEECKLRVDEDMIFTIKENAEVINDIILSLN